MYAGHPSEDIQWCGTKKDIGGGDHSVLELMRASTAKEAIRMKRRIRKIPRRKIGLVILDQEGEKS